MTYSVQGLDEARLQPYPKCGDHCNEDNRAPVVLETLGEVFFGDVRLDYANAKIVRRGNKTVDSGTKS